ncbi:MAG: polysaccharide biosynthesis/export family protein [Cyanobacteria bacterium P01_F01_bin.150]
MKTSEGRIHSLFSLGFDVFGCPSAIGDCCTRLLSGRITRLTFSLLLLLLSHSLSHRSAIAQPTLVDAVSQSEESNVPTRTVLTTEEAYLLGVGDYLRVDVFNIPDYGGEFRVLAGGELNLPVVGSVSVEGLSLQQAAARVEQRLAPYVRRPRVTLSLLEIRPLQVAIAGEVSRPGAYRIAVNDGSNRFRSNITTLTQVIELAGGITQLADIRQIKVCRRRSPVSSRALENVYSGDGGCGTSSQQARFEPIPIDLWSLLREGDLDADLRLQDGDRIIIPTATNLSSDDIAELASASFSPDQITVNVVGEVDAPGAIQVPPNTPLNQAILAAGGFNIRAKSTVNLIRLNPNGTASQQEIEVDFSQGIDDATNPALRPNDTVIVQRSGLTRVTDTVDAVLSPVNGLFRVLRLFGL